MECYDVPTFRGGVFIRLVYRLSLFGGNRRLLEGYLGVFI